MTVEALLWVVCIFAVIAWVLFMAAVKLIFNEIMLLRADHEAIRSIIGKWVFELKRMNSNEMDK